MASTHCYKRSEEDYYDDNKSNCKPNHQSQQYASHDQNHGYGQSYDSSGYGPQYSSHPDGVKSETIYYSETTKTCYDDQYGMGKPNKARGHNSATFARHNGSKQCRRGQIPFEYLKDHHSGTHQTGYDPN
ncbi:hypothetical protein, partial [Yersinia pestis]|uniref:hypothetical protein n=1 Tax=Yersinia pestis TaxID=632 RepID=UPI001C2DCB42